jgi:hypothetical protein
MGGLKKEKSRPPLAIIACLWASSCLAVSWAQNERNKPTSQLRPNFSGTWVLDKSKSQISEYDLLSDMDLTLVISQKEPEIKIIRKYFLKGYEGWQELLYFSDQRGETNPSIIEGETIKSKTKWEGRKLVTRSSIRSMFTPGVMITYDRVDEWKLSNDGQTLTETTRIYNLQSSNDKPIIMPEARNVPPLQSSAREGRKVFRRALNE